MSDLGGTGCGDPIIHIEFDDTKGCMHISLSDEKSSITAEILIIGEGAPLVGCDTYTLAQGFLKSFIKRNLRKEGALCQLSTESTT